MRYLVAMHLRKKRRFAVLIMAAFFAVSLGLHGLLTTAANAQMTEGALHMAMPSDGEPMNCPGHDGADQANCLATCAAFVGVLFEPVALPFVQIRVIHAGARIVSLSDRSIPPDPYPPRPSALI